MYSLQGNELVSFIDIWQFLAVFHNYVTGSKNQDLDRFTCVLSLPKALMILMSFPLYSLEMQYKMLMNEKYQPNYKHYIKKNLSYLWTKTRPPFYIAWAIQWIVSSKYFNKFYCGESSASITLYLKSFVNWGFILPTT